MSTAALIVVPPFGGVDRPSLGVHLLQACARAQGYEVEVLYANILFARRLGVELYESICFAPTIELLGERVFAKAAFGKACLDPGGDAAAANFRKASFNDPLQTFGADLADLQKQACSFADDLARELARADAGIIGCTTTFEQNLAAISILRRIKAQNPNKITLLGGANCDGAMADGLSRSCRFIDHVFSGESEETFPAFLAAIRAGQPRTDQRVVQGRPCLAMEKLPTPDFSEYYAQASSISRSEFDIDENAWLPYEASRGCWWGERSHCTFCGINGSGMVFRQKPAGKVLDELQSLLPAHPNRRILMVDNIMPLSYFDDLLPKLPRVADDLHIFYEQKSNLTLAKVGRLRQAGVRVIQPGIEALSTPLLKHMRKGVTAAQNIALLRYALAWDVAVNWNLLHDFPDDREEWYEDVLAFVPLLRHLNPPTALCELSIDRFSPYFDDPESFGITNVRPMPSYEEIYPTDVETRSIAYHFIADYDSACRRSPHLGQELEAAVGDWRRAWTGDEARPVLHVCQAGEDTYLLADSRFSARPVFRFLSEDQAMLALGRVRAEDWPEHLVEWGLDHARVCIPLDGTLVPLATAEPTLLERFDARRFAGPHQVLPCMTVPA